MITEGGNEITPPRTVLTENSTALVREVYITYWLNKGVTVISISLFLCG